MILIPWAGQGQPALWVDLPRDEVDKVWEALRIVRRIPSLRSLVAENLKGIRPGLGCCYFDRWYEYEVGRDHDPQWEAFSIVHEAIHARQFARYVKRDDPEWEREACVDAAPVFLDAVYSPDDQLYHWWTTHPEGCMSTKWWEDPHEHTEWHEGSTKRV